MSDNIKSKYGIYNFFLIFIIFLFIIIRLSKYFETDYFIIWFDSAQYAAASFASVWSKLFWSDGIPPLYPFFLKYFIHLNEGELLIDNNILSYLSYHATVIKGIEILDDYPYYLVRNNFDIISISIIQLIISLLSFIVFAISVSKLFTCSSIKLISILTILFLGLESSIIIWDKHVLTESITISLLLLTFSFLIHIKKVIKNNVYLTMFILVIALFSLIKITNNYFIVLLIPFVLFHFWRTGFQNKFQYGLLVTVLFILFAFNQVLLFYGDRTNVPMKDIISSRISTNGYEDIYTYFRNAGMPELPEEVTGKLWTAPFENYPELEDWWINKSSNTYQKFLITHPVYFFIRPFEYTNEYNKSVFHYFTPDLAFHEKSIKNKQQIIFSDAYLVITLLIILLLGLYSYVYRINQDVDNLLLPIYTLLAATLLYIIIWHADLGELDRHLILCATMYRISLLLFLLQLIYNIYEFRDRT